MNENMTKAEHDLEFVIGSLRDELSTCDPVAGIIVLQMIRDAADLCNRVHEYRHAQLSRGATWDGNCYGDFAKAASLTRSRHGNAGANTTFTPGRHADSAINTNPK